KRVEQLAAFLAGRGLELARERGPRLGAPLELLGDAGRVLHQQALLVAELGRLDLAMENRKPASEVGQSFEIGAKQEPILLGRSLRQPIRHRGKIELVEQSRVDQLDLVRVEMRRR